MIYNNQAFKELTQLLDSFAFRVGKARAFESLLDYVVYGFCLNSGIPDWPFDKEQSQAFGKMFGLWVNTVKTELDKEPLTGFCDVPGNIHQVCLYSKTGKGFLGQFFTPEHVCHFMAECNMLELKDNDPASERPVTVNDPCCGSGRLLLSAHVLCQKKHRKAYCAAKDIDPNCVKMTTANFLLHGVVGEVVWGDGLKPEDGRLCFLVNENLNNPFSELFGIPHCRVVPYEQTMQGNTFVKS